MRLAGEPELPAVSLIRNGPPPLFAALSARDELLDAGDSEGRTDQATGCTDGTFGAPMTSASSARIPSPEMERDERSAVGALFADVEPSKVADPCRSD